MEENIEDGKEPGKIGMEETRRKEKKRRRKTKQTEHPPLRDLYKTDLNLLTDQEKFRVLCESLERGLYEYAKQMLNAGTNVNLNFDNMLPLYFALSNKACTVDIVKMIIEAGFPPNGVIEIRKKQTALHEAVKRNHMSIVEYLLALSANPNAKDHKGLTPLHFATQSKNEDLIKLLIKNGADIDMECGENCTPLFYAIASQNFETVTLLLSLGADTNHTCRHGRDSLTPLHFATGVCNFKIVKLLLEKGANVNCVIPESRETSLHLAVKINTTNSVEKVSAQCIVELLVKEGSDLSAKDDSELTPLHLAVRHNNYIAAKFLISHGSPLNTDFTFHSIMKTCHKDLIQQSLEFGANWDVKDNEVRYPVNVFLTTMIFYYISHKTSNAQNSDIVEIVKLIWKHGFPVEMTMPKNVNWPKKIIPPFLGTLTELVNSHNMLFQGVKANNVTLMRKAIARGADLRSCSKDLTFPLHFVAAKGNDASLRLFLSQPIHVNILNKEGKTALHLAAESGHKTCCRLLLENGAVYNCISEKCPETPLQLAKRNRKDGVVALLRRIKTVFQTAKKDRNLMRMTPMMAIMNCQDRNGKSILAIALENNMEYPVEVLLKKRLRINASRM